MFIVKSYQHFNQLNGRYYQLLVEVKCIKVCSKKANGFTASGIVYCKGDFFLNSLCKLKMGAKNKMNENWETIIQLEEDDNEIKLLGARDDTGTWSFRIKAGVAKGDAHSWKDALKLLNDDSWIERQPIRVHPLFSDKIWKEVSDKGLPNATRKCWAKACFPKLMQLVGFLKASSHTVVLTGAGMSTESGVPDFRSPSGWWKQIDPRTVATIDALENNYALFHEFYSMRVKALAELTPHKGHELLAEWQQKGLIQLIATQNVDNFHQRAGASFVQSLHGSISSYRCHSCGIKSTEDGFPKKGLVRIVEASSDQRLFYLVNCFPRHLGYIHYNILKKLM